MENQIEKSWATHLGDEFKMTYMKELIHFLEKEKKSPDKKTEAKTKSRKQEKEAPPPVPVKVPLPANITLFTAEPVFIFHVPAVVTFAVKVCVTSDGIILFLKFPVEVAFVYDATSAVPLDVGFIRKSLLKVILGVLFAIKVKLPVSIGVPEA